MTNHTVLSGNQPAATFRRLMISLSESIGEHHIPILEEASHPSDLIKPHAVHYDLIKMICRAVYRANKCFHLDAPINFEATFDKLGEIHGKLLQSEKTDIDQMRLIQDIGTYASEFFQRNGMLPKLDEPVLQPDYNPLEQSNVMWVGQSFARTG